MYKLKPSIDQGVCVVPTDSNGWDEFLHTYMKAWVKRIQNWVLKVLPEHPVLVVRYEDLKIDSTREVERMLAFLQLPFSSDQVSQKLEEDFTTFKRVHSDESEFEHYTDDQRDHINSAILQVVELAEASNMTHVLRLNEYLRTL